MCRGKVIADCGSVNVKLTNMTWNKESIQVSSSGSQSQATTSTQPGQTVRLRRDSLMTRRSKSMRAARRKYEPAKRKLLSTKYAQCGTVPSQPTQSEDTEAIALEDESTHENILTPSPTHTPFKRASTLRRSHAFRKSSRPGTRGPAFRIRHSPVHTQYLAVRLSEAGDNQIEDTEEEVTEYKLRYEDDDSDCNETDSSQSLAAPEHHKEESLDPSQITLEMKDDSDVSVATSSQNDSLDNSILSDVQQSSRDLELSPSMDSENFDVAASWGNILGTTDLTDSEDSSQRTSTESTSSFATTGSCDSCSQTRRPYRKTRSPRVRTRIRRRPRKIIVVGDMCSGKSNIVSAYCRDRFTESYMPTMLNCCSSDADVFGEKIELVVVEVSGRDDYKRLRQCAYRKVDAAVLCYSIANAASLENIVKKWMPELKEHANNTPFILVGTKKDLRDDVVFSCEEETISHQPGSVLSTEQGKQVAKTIGAESFHECSALYRDGTRNVFETVTKVALRKSRRKRKAQDKSIPTCTIL